MGSTIISSAGKLLIYFVTHLFTLFGLIIQSFLRLKDECINGKKNSWFILHQSQEDHQMIQNISEGKNNNNHIINNSNCDEEHDESESVLKFRFSTYEEFVKGNGELGKFDELQSAKLSDESNFIESKLERGDELEDLGVKNEEKSGKLVDNLGLLCVHDTEETNPEIISDFVGGKMGKNASNHELEELGVEKEEKSGKLEGKNPEIISDFVGGKMGKNSSNHELEELGVEKEDKSGKLEGKNPEIISDFGGKMGKNSEVQPWKLFNDMTSATEFYYDEEDEFLMTDSESDSEVSSSKFSLRSSLIDSISDDGFSLDDNIDYEEEFEEFSIKNDAYVQKMSKGYETDIEELEFSLDEPNLGSGNVFVQQENVANDEKLDFESRVEFSSNLDDMNEVEKEWEHQELVEQLKMEIRKVRNIGLPTILEESESPKIDEDLKPWKIEEKFEYESTMDEMYKFYKNYKERMRKLDILNYQKMYAIGFLQLKDPLQSFTRQSFSIQAMPRFPTLNCWQCLLNSAKEPNKPVKKFNQELESDQETIYVGQMCLSWEFLRWEYGKALELWDFDPRGIHKYNDVAEKFQQFQVLLTRFMEDEHFQGPSRVQYYVKNRCVQRNLLEVPLIREDTSRDTKKQRRMVSTKDAICSVNLVEMIEDSIRIFWHFIRADKYTRSSVLLKCRRCSNIEPQNQGDPGLYAQVRSSLQKKEKKLRELSKTKKCMLRKIQTQQESVSDPVLYFFSQVDLRLVQRVLNMSKVTAEQLVWCRDKLSKINFAGRNLHVEPSVLFFPCT